MVYLGISPPFSQYSAPLMRVSSAARDRVRRGSDR